MDPKFLCAVVLFACVFYTCEAQSMKYKPFKTESVFWPKQDQQSKNPQYEDMQNDNRAQFRSSEESQEHPRRRQMWSNPEEVMEEDQPSGNSNEYSGASKISSSILRSRPSISFRRRNNPQRQRNEEVNQIFKDSE